MSKIIFTFCLTSLLIMTFGCSHNKAQTPNEPYRTISTKPLRNNQAAAKHNLIGLDQLDENQLDDAAHSFELALQADIEFGPAHNNLGKVYYNQRDLYKAAWEFQYAIKLLPKHAQPHNNLGLVLEHAGELDAAVEAYRHAVALDENNTQYIGNLTRAQLKRGDQHSQVALLLDQLIASDTRPDWLQWAKTQRTQLAPQQ